MKKAILSLVLVFFVSVFILGCGGGEIITDNLKFRASNVIFRSRASSEFTDQKVYADDVVLDNVNTSLTADNVQKAFEETQPKLSEIIIGEWDVVCYKGSSESYDITQKTGTVIFNADNTFSFTEVGQEFCSLYDSQNYQVNPIRYNIYDESIISFSNDYKVITEEKIWNEAYLRDFTLISANKLVSKNTANSYIFILTRKQ